MNAAWQSFKLGVVVVAVVLALPVVVPVGAISWAIEARRRRRVAAAFRCLSCGLVLGRASLKRSDEVWAAYVRDLMEKHPGVRLRLLRPHDAICTSCGAAYRFQQSERTFVRVESPAVAGAYDADPRSP